jgi:hypothetical protein
VNSLLTAYAGGGPTGVKVKYSNKRLYFVCFDVYTYVDPRKHSWTSPDSTRVRVSGQGEFFAFAEWLLQNHETHTHLKYLARC